MPPKTSSSTKPKLSQGPTKEELSAIKNYLAQKPDFEKLNKDAKASPQAAPPRQETEYDRKLRDAVKAAIQDTVQAAKVNMPVHPKEEEAGSNLTDQVAKESKDSTASTHPIHHNDKLATAEDHKANPGPVVSQDIGEPASKEDLKKRAEELNKK